MFLSSCPKTKWAGLVVGCDSSRCLADFRAGRFDSLFFFFPSHGLSCWEWFSQFCLPFIHDLRHQPPIMNLSKDPDDPDQHRHNWPCPRHQQGKTLKKTKIEKKPRSEKKEGSSMDDADSVPIHNWNIQNKSTLLFSNGVLSFDLPAKLKKAKLFLPCCFPSSVIPFPKREKTMNNTTAVIFAF